MQGRQNEHDGFQRSNRRQFLGSLAGLVALGTGLGRGAGSQDQQSTVTIRLDNVAADAWKLVETDDKTVAAVGAENPTLALTVGTRYRFVNDGGDDHPLEFRDGEYGRLLSQAISGEFEDEEAVDWQADDEAHEYAFTLTEELADRMENYVCRFHTSMFGEIDIIREPPAAVAFQDQSTSGSTVTVDAVRLDDGGFLTIHDSRLLDGQPRESVRGVSAALDSGTYEGIEVTLEEALAEEDTLIAMPHRDEPADGEYRFVESGGDEDPPYLDLEGNPVVDTAEVAVDAGQDAPEVSVSIDNVGVSAWEVTDADAGVAPLDRENPTLRLRVGTRYTVENGGWSSHPFALRDADGNLLLTQGSGGAFADDPAVGWTDDGATVAFTVTEDLAAAAANYVCTVHPSMEGTIETLGPDAPGADATITGQESDGEAVVVDTVRLDDGGFLTVHDGRLLDSQPLESVRGVTDYLPPGIYEDVEMALDEPVTEEQPLIAMPHRDEPADGEYRFVESGGDEDPPYLDTGGAAVVDDATITVTDATDSDTGSVDGDDASDGSETDDEADGGAGDSTGDGADGGDGGDGSDTDDDGASGSDDSTDGGEQTTDDGNGAGFGPAAGAAGIGSLAAYAARKLNLRREAAAVEAAGQNGERSVEPGEN
jgi:plastocyanin